MESSQAVKSETKRIYVGIAFDNWKKIQMFFSDIIRPYYNVVDVVVVVN